MYTNINIFGEQESFNYIVEYQKKNFGYISNLEYMIEDQAKNIYFCTGNNYIQKQNMWIQLNESKYIDFIPSTYNYGRIIVYFPTHSIESYSGSGLYAITISMKIADRCVILGSKIINRIDALACETVKKYMNQTYYECIEFDIIDPFDLVFDDRWSDFRKKICGEANDEYYINTEGSSLYISLHPIQFGEDSNFIKLDKFDGGQNSINISKSTNNYLHLHIQDNTKRSLKVDERPGIEFSLHFNEVYNDDIVSYMKETYGIDDFSIKYDILIGNKDNIYVNLSENKAHDISCTFTKDQLNEDNFRNWIGWTEGIYIIGSIDILNSEGDSILYIVSNTIPLTRELYKYIMKTDDFEINGYVINNVNLDYVNMEFKQINITNKLENNIFHSTVVNNGSNVSVPVFYKSVELYETILHPEVTETICINLDYYKSKVNSFLVQIEGIKFKEVGRSSAGVFFKIIGNKLPKKLSSGTLYILNQDSELVTTGKYKYIF